MSIKQGPRQIKTVRCPYIPEHIMPEGSLLNHLTKCSATNKHLFTKCRYNPLHVYPNTIIEEHYKKCKDRMKYEEQHSQSSDDWGQDTQKKQQPKVVNSVVGKRQGNRIQEKNDKKALNTSNIKKIQLDDSDDQDWNPIIMDSNQEQKNTKSTNNSALNQSKSKRTENNNFQNGKISKENSQITQFQQKSVVSKNINKSRQQENSKNIQQNIQDQDQVQDKLISLESQSFQSIKSRSEKDQSLDSKQESGEKILSDSQKQKNRDNSKETQKKVLSKDEFEADDF